MNIGYGFWGFLGDKKFNKDKQEISTPDGNAFYSWSIIKALEENNKVFSLMPDRDKYGFEKLSSILFKAWAMEDRLNAYEDMIRTIEDSDIEKIIETRKLITKHLEQTKLDLVIWEWRWKIPGRNTEEDIGTENFQPDLVLQDLWLNYCKENKIPVIVFDLDYKLTLEDIEKYNVYGVIELGNKWQNLEIAKHKRINIPFDFAHIHDLEIKEPEDLLVYIGNRYERDWCIDKYIPEDVEGIVVHGNWLESNRDSAQVWPKIKFAKRLQTNEMYEAYSKAAVTPLLAKKEYCEQGFMTARIIEAVFYGCVPLFIEEYQDCKKYIPEDLRPYLIIHDKTEVLQAAMFFKDHPEIRKKVIEEMREHLKFMDCKNFVEDIMQMIK